MKESEQEVRECDVLIVGAGPAGSAAGTVLAEAGFDVVLVERERFPRYRVGESLIPHCWFALERLGVNAELAASDFVVPKHSVQFISTEGVRSAPFYFHEHFQHESSRTWQVRRSDFDQLLAKNAVAKGCELWHETTAKALLRDEGGVVGARVVRAAEREIDVRAVRARVTIDASGRDAFAQARERWRIQDERLKKVALWSYYDGAKRDAGLDEGATTIAYLPEKGWFWYLPMADDRVSVGVVAEPDYLYRDTRDAVEIFEREVRTQPWVRDHVEGARRAEPVRVTSEFSYRSRHCASNGLVLTGDAFSFLDPVFSSGVFFALRGGILAGDAVASALRAGDVAAERFAEYGETLRAEMESMRQLVYAFYDSAFNFGAFLKEHPDFRADLTDVLIGNLSRDFKAFFGAMASFADLPEPLPHGAPLASG